MSDRPGPVVGDAADRDQEDVAEGPGGVRGQRNVADELGPALAPEQLSGPLLHDLLEPLAVVPQLGLGLRLVVAEPLRLEGSRYRGAEEGEPVLDEEVGGAGLHALDRDRLPRVPGDDEEGDVEAALAEEREGAERPEPREPVVGEDDVGRVAEAGDVLLLRLHSLAREGQSLAPELERHQLRVVGLVLDDQDTKGGRHGADLVGPGHDGGAPSRTRMVTRTPGRSSRFSSLTVPPASATRSAT